MALVPSLHFSLFFRKKSINNCKNFPRLFSSIFSCVKEGTPETSQYKVFVTKNDKISSFWHSVPLFADQNNGLYNYVNEIPKGTRAKMEIATKIENNPIVQDVKKGNLRYFTYGDIPFNYGCLPQTWEDPHKVHAETKLGGDNDPLDVVEISSSFPVGTIVPVKVLGILALLDEGETDWKIIAVAKSNPLFAKLNDISDLQKSHPEVLTSIKEWFENYKTTDGKPKNEFAFNGSFLDNKYATNVITETHEFYKSLIKDALWTPPKH